MPSGQALWLQYDGGFAADTATAAFVVYAPDGATPIAGWGRIVDDAFSNNQAELTAACDAIHWLIAHAREYLHDYVAPVGDSRLTTNFFNKSNPPKHLRLYQLLERG